MSSRSFHVYLASVIAVGVAIFIYSLWRVHFPSQGFILLTFSVLTFIAELVPVYLPDKAAVSVSFALVYASILLTSPFVAAVVAFGAITCATLQGKWHGSLFNGAQFAISAFLSGMVFKLLGGYTYEFMWHDYHFYVAIVGSILAFFFSNASLVMGVVALQKRIPFRSLWRKDVNGIFIQYFALFPLSLLLYFVYIQVGFVGMVLFFFPLMVARYSFKLFADTKKMHMELLRALTSAVDAKDPYTQGHSARVAWLATALAEKIRLSEKQREILEYAAILHDVGKIGVADAILGKNGRLTEEEYRLIQNHPVIGHRIVEGIDFLERVADIILAHHERCDGRGYPHGKEGEQIPLEAKIVAVADVFDALTSARPYRPAYTVEEALMIMENEEKGHFDPQIFALLKEIIAEKGWEPNVG